MGWIFTDLLADDIQKGTVKHTRNIDSHFLSAQECIMSGYYQNLHPNPCSYASKGSFGSKFVTVCVTGKSLNEVNFDLKKMPYEICVRFSVVKTEKYLTNIIYFHFQKISKSSNIALLCFPRVKNTPTIQLTAHPSISIVRKKSYGRIILVEYRRAYSLPHN